MILLTNKYKTKVHKVVLDEPRVLSSGIALLPGTYRYETTPDRVEGAGVRHIADDNRQHAVVTPAPLKARLHLNAPEANKLRAIIDILKGRA